MNNEPLGLTPEAFIRSYERKGISELFDKSVTVLESKTSLPKMEVEYLQGDVFYTIRERMIAAVLDKTDEAIKDAIVKAVDNGKIQTAYILDAEKVQKALDKLKPEAPLSENYLWSYIVCPDCGCRVHRDIHPTYCGYCGKKLDWEKFDKRKEFYKNG